MGGQRRVRRGALMYLQADGWQQGRKDKIDLDAGSLKDKAGLYTCPPTAPGQKAFHATLQVRQEPINVRFANPVPCARNAGTEGLDVLLGFDAMIGCRAFISVMAAGRGGVL